MGLDAAREQLHAAMRRLAAEGFVVGSAGNASLRIDEGTAVVSAGGVPYDQLVPGDHPVVDLHTGEWSDGRPPTSELALHLALLRGLPGADAVVHTHSPYAAGFSVAREPLEFVCNESAGVGSERILVTAPYAPPGSHDLADAVIATLRRQPGSRACLIANHGPVAIGTTLDAAVLAVVQVEWIAKISFVARTVGRVHVVPPDQQDAIGRNYGFTIAREPGGPTAEVIT